MTLSFVSSVPTSGATDVFINKPIELVFNETLSTTYLTDDVIYLYDLDSGTRVPIFISRKATDTTTIVIQTSEHLKENTNYRIVVVGTDQNFGFHLSAENGDTLTTTVVVLFTTGNSVYKVDTEVEKNAANLTLEGDLFLPTNVKALGYEFTLEKIRPQNNTHGNSTTLTGDNTVTFTFTKNLYTGAQDYTTWIDVTCFPILDDPQYLGSGNTIGQGTIPGYSISVTGANLVVLFDNELPNNAAIQMSLLSNILSEDNDEYSGSLEYNINIETFPAIYGLHTIRREIQPASANYTDNFIGALMFKNTIWLWERLGQSLSLASLPYAARQFVTYATILDLLEDKEYEKFIVAGTRRQLGDLNVSVDNLIGRLAMKMAKYQKNKEIAFESLVKGWQFRTGVTSHYLETAATINRLWFNVNSRYTDPSYKYFQPDLPSTNITINRWAKTNNPMW